MAEEKAPASKKPEATKKEGKTKRPSALKRDLQNEKHRLRNRSFRSSVQTALRNLEESITQKATTDTLKEKLNLVYRLMDLGVKKRVYKPKKAARTKSRLALRCAKV